MNIAVELMPSDHQPLALLSAHVWKIRRTWSDVQSRSPASHASYSSDVSDPGAIAVSQNSISMPSLLPPAKHVVSVAMIASHAAARSSHVAGGASGSSPAAAYSALL